MPQSKRCAFTTRSFERRLRSMEGTKSRQKRVHSTLQHSSSNMSGSSKYTTTAFAFSSQGGNFKRLTIERSGLGPSDVEFDIKFCGVCHSDVHVAENIFGSTQYPLVPGHELAGVVTAVGGEVKDVKVGDKVGVGCMVDACLDCEVTIDK